MGILLFAIFFESEFFELEESLDFLEVSSSEFFEAFFVETGVGRSESASSPPPP
jgi:hypothetical protein